MRVVVLAGALALVPSVALAQEDGSTRTRSHRVSLRGIGLVVCGVVAAGGWVLKKVTGKA